MSDLIPFDEDPFVPSDPPLIPDFTPVPRKTRRVHGWTPERQRQFIEALADTGSVTAAAGRVGMTPEGAYYLRRAEGAGEFRAAWEAALEQGVSSLADIAIERAKHGVAVPVFHKGEVVGEKRSYNDRLLMFTLKHHMPSRYGAELRAGGSKSQAQKDREHEEELALLDATIAEAESKWRAIRAGFLRSIADDPAKRAAWELLTEAVPDWGDPEAPMPPCDGLPDINHNRPDMIIPTAAWKLDEVIGARKRSGAGPG